ncbi:hypothetical protein GCM10009574_009760 [Streptomyces asiaticus]|uniref:LysM domain-containing protein n=1 Tax=Streptomyces rhizosphaericus TaxID=114699 RepID=A0ABN1SE28_9ACTN
MGTALDGEAEAAPEQPVSAAEPPSAATAAAAVVSTDRRGIPAAAGAVPWEVSGINGDMNGGTLPLFVQWNDWVKCVNDSHAIRSGQPFFRGN